MFHGKDSAKTTAISHSTHARLRQSHGNKLQFTQINVCDSNQVDGERGAANSGPVWVEFVSFEKQVGYPVTYKGNRDRASQNKRTDEATRTVARIARLPRGFGFEAPARLETNAISRYQFAIECGMPSEQSLGGLTAQIMRTSWPTGANMRSREVVLAILVKGHRTDPVQVWACQTLTMLRTMLRANATWVPLWQQAWKAMQKRRIRPGTEGLAANATRVLRRLGWSWESAVEVKTREGEKFHVTQCPEGYWNHKIREAAREWRLRQATTRKAARDLEKIDIQMSTRLLRERSLTSIQKGQLRAILAGAVYTCARMWARETVCGHENEDLAHLWWK